MDKKAPKWRSNWLRLWSTALKELCIYQVTLSTLKIGNKRNTVEYCWYFLKGNYQMCVGNGIFFSHLLTRSELWDLSPFWIEKTNGKKWEKAPLRPFVSNFRYSSIIYLLQCSSTIDRVMLFQWGNATFYLMMLLKDLHFIDWVLLHQNHFQNDPFWPFFKCFGMNHFKLHSCLWSFIVFIWDLFRRKYVFNRPNFSPTGWLKVFTT